MNNTITHEIPEGYRARIEGNKVIIEKEYDALMQQLLICLASDAGVLPEQCTIMLIKDRGCAAIQFLPEGSMQPCVLDLQKLPRWEKVDKFPTGVGMFFIDNDYLYCPLNQSRIELSALFYLPHPRK